MRLHFIRGIAGLIPQRLKVQAQVTVDVTRRKSARNGGRVDQCVSVFRVVDMTVPICLSSSCK